MEATGALVPEFAVSDWRASFDFHCRVLSFSIVYKRPEDGFACLERDNARLMIDQIGVGRTFVVDEAPLERPCGRGLNVEITVPTLAPLLEALGMEGIRLHLAPEERWYRRGDVEPDVRQFAVADPDGYLLRFSEGLGECRLSAAR